MGLLDRRGFVASLAAIGMAGTAKSAGEEKALPLKISPIREGGVDEVLKVAHFEIAAGATKPFRILHASDTHLNFWDVTDFCGNEARERHFGTRWVRFPQALTSLLATIGYARERGLPIFHTGDLIDWNTCGNAVVCRRTLDGVDFFYALGNHEYHTSAGKTPALSAEGARERVATFVSNDLTVASRVVNGINFVAFDNGELNLREETVARVKAEFGKGLPVVMLCHIPPTYTPTFISNGLRMQRQILRGQGVPEERLAALKPGGRIELRYNERTMGFWDWARGQKLLKAVLCGHTHVEERDRFSDTADMYVAGGNYEGFASEITFT